MWKVIARTYEEFLADNCFRMAAALSYHAAFSLAPLCVLVITLAGLVVDAKDVSGLVATKTTEVLGPDASRTIQSTVDYIQHSPSGFWAALISAAAVIFGATNLMVELQASLDEIWKVKPDPKQGGVNNFLMKRVISFTMILAIAGVLLASMLLSWGISHTMSLAEGWFGSQLSAVLVVVADFLAMLLIYVVVFTAIFRFVPDAKVAWSDAALGGLVTGIAFLLGRNAIGAYLGSQNLTTMYGAGGSVVVMLLWVYYSALLILVGAEFTQVWGTEWGEMPVPLEGAVAVANKADEGEVEPATVPNRPPSAII